MEAITTGPGSFPSASNLCLSVLCFTYVRAVLLNGYCLHRSFIYMNAREHKNPVHNVVTVLLINASDDGRACTNKRPMEVPFENT